jgi:type VI secretion system protein
MKAGLFELLTGRFADGSYLYEVHPSQYRVLSVIDNLNRLFNTRQGTLDHVPGYGLPDFGEIYKDKPESVEQVRSAIQDAVERYEPRFTRVRVDRQENEHHARLVFLLSGELVDGQEVAFETTIASNDLIQVNQKTRMY